MIYKTNLVAYKSTTPGIPKSPTVKRLSAFIPTIVLANTVFTIDKKIAPQKPLIIN